MKKQETYNKNKTHFDLTILIRTRTTTTTKWNKKNMFLSPFFYNLNRVTFSKTRALFFFLIYTQKIAELSNECTRSILRKYIPQLYITVWEFYNFQLYI